MRRFGFTLMEVNLAMFIMAMGTLGLVSLYSFGYRENQQSNEDVQAAAVASRALNTMVAALSSTNMTWTAWRGIGAQPAEGWGKYAGDGTNAGSVQNDGSSKSSPLSDPSSVARSVFNKVVGASGSSGNFDDQGMALGIVVTPSSDYRVYSVAIRAGKRPATLCFQPLYYTEVYFQGTKKEGGK